MPCRCTAAPCSRRSLRYSSVRRACSLSSAALQFLQGCGDIVLDTCLYVQSSVGITVESFPCRSFSVRAEGTAAAAPAEAPKKAEGAAAAAPQKVGTACTLVSTQICARKSSSKTVGCAGAPSVAAGGWRHAEGRRSGWQGALACFTLRCGWLSPHCLMVSGVPSLCCTEPSAFGLSKPVCGEASASQGRSC